MHIPIGSRYCSVYAREAAELKLKDNIFITHPATRHSIVNAREKSVFAAQHFHF